MPDLRPFYTPRTSWDPHMYSLAAFERWFGGLSADFRGQSIISAHCHNYYSRNARWPTSASRVTYCSYGWVKFHCSLAIFIQYWLQYALDIKADNILFKSPIDRDYIEEPLKTDLAIPVGKFELGRTKYPIFLSQPIPHGCSPDDPEVWFRFMLWHCRVSLTVCPIVFK